MRSQLKKLAPGLFAMVSLFPWFPAAAQDYASGVSLFRKQNYQKAALEFVRVMRKDPNNSNAMYYAAASYQRLGNNGQAERYYKELIQKFPSSAGAAYARKALASMRGGGAQSSGGGGSQQVQQALQQLQQYGQTRSAQPSSRHRMAPGDYIPDHEKVYFELDEKKHPRVKCLVNGRPVSMLFDTGAEMCAVDQDTARSVGLNIPKDAPTTQVTGSVGVENARVVNTQIELGKIKRTVPLMVLEKSKHQVLGMSFYGDLQYRIDNSLHAISFAKDASSMGDYNTEDIPFTKRGKDIIVEVKVNGKAFPMCFDTGAQGTIFPGAALAGGGSGWELVGQNTASGIGGQGGVKGVYRVNTLELGRIRKNNMEVVVDPNFTHPYGLLGQDFYGDKTYTIDQTNNRIRMRR